MKVAIIHNGPVGMRGGEKVLEPLCRMFPQAVIIIHACVAGTLSTARHCHRIIGTRIGRLPFARRLYQSYLTLMPGALESVDLAGYDLMISSEAGQARGVIAPRDAFHRYCFNSPMRCLWDQYRTCRAGVGRLARLIMRDVTSAARVDHFIAKSTHFASRMRKYWRREAEELHPPVEVRAFMPVPTSEPGDFYLQAGGRAPDKRPDVAIEPFRRPGLPLVVISETGRLFRDQAVEPLAEAVREAEAAGPLAFDPARLPAHAAKLDETSSRQGIARAPVAANMLPPPSAGVAR